MQKQQTSEYVSWVKIRYKRSPDEKNVFIGITYIPPNTSKMNSSTKSFKIHDELEEEILEKMTMGHVFIAGDLNSRSSNILDFVPSDDYIDFPCVTCPRRNVDNVVNTYGRRLIDLCIKCGVQILNGRDLFANDTNQYTCFRYNGKSVVDLLMTSAPSLPLITDFQIIDRNVNSDHAPISFTLALKNETISQNIATRDTTSELKRYMWDFNQIDNYALSLVSPANTTYYEEFLCNIINNSLNPTQVIDSFYSYLFGSISSVFKIQKSRDRNNQFPTKRWFDSECKQLKNKVNDSYRLNAPVNIQNSLHKEYKRVIQFKKREFQGKETEKLSYLCKLKQQEFWKRWKKLKGKSHNYDHISIDKFTDFYRKASRPKVNPDFDAIFMSEVYEAMNKCADINEIPANRIIDDILNGPITLDELTKALKCAKTGKACGIDGIQMEFLKFSKGLLDKPLVSLFNYIFDNGIYPKAWSTGLINPIFKQYDKSSAENYRKITLLTSLSKTFENILNNRLTYCKETVIPGDPLQNGFNKDTPVTDNVFILNGIIEKYKATKKPLYTCFVDFKSAFDNVNREALFYKLIKQDIKGKFYNIIKSMLNNAKSRVKWDNNLGDIIDNLYGVLQGGVISPALFKIFIEDLPKYLDPEDGVEMGTILIHYLLHADDLVLISETSTGLQKLLHGLEIFCCRWHITVNLVKTNVMIFNKSHASTREVQDFLLFKNKIAEVDKYKYLGIIFTNSRNTFAENITYLRNKAQRAIGDIRTNIYKIIGVNKPYDLMMKLFDSQIIPILEYGAEIWYTGKNMPHYEAVHLGYLKYVLGVKPNTSTLAIYGETGRFPLVLRQEDQAIKLWLRLKFSNVKKPINHVFDELESLQNLGYTTWLSKIKNILGDVYISAVENENPHKLIASLKETRYKTFMESFLTDINDNTLCPKLRTYSIFKLDYRKEAYLCHNMNRNYMTAISRFRTSSHSLHIETGRYTRPYTPIENRLCSFCTVNSIDDEKHMLISCTFHDAERNTLFKNIQPFLEFQISDYSEPDLFFIIMNLKQPQALHALGNYLFTGFNRRKNTPEETVLT